MTSTLYIANTTKQDHDFAFRRPEAQIPTVVKIPAGTQAAIIRDGDTTAIDHVINQHRKYGLISVAEAAKLRGFVGLCYSIDKPMAFKDMKLVFEKNDKVLRKQGEDNVRQIAAAVNEGIDTKLQDAGIPTQAAHVAVEVVEENTEGQPTSIAVGAEVVKDDSQVRHGGGRRGRRG